MTQKRLVLETISELPDEVSLDEIAERIEFLAAIQKGIDKLDQATARYMACKIIWSPASRDDLRDIVRFIARDNPQRAESFAYELMRRTDILQQHPEAGRIVPEYRNPQLREIIYRPYRIVYRLNIDRKFIEIARVWHAARGTPLA